MLKNTFSFTISGRDGTPGEAPEAGDLALSGTLSGSVVNGEATYEEKTITATSNGIFVAGDPFYFKNGVFILTSAASAAVTELTGRIYGSIGGADNSVGYNYPDLIKETESVKLIDPTREKSSNYVKIEGEVFPPSSVPNSYYQGKIYFPTLDPHLSKRFFFDPNRGKDGALVLAGKFMDELVG